MKRNLQATAKAFQAEGKVSSDPVGMCLSASCSSLCHFFAAPLCFFCLFVKTIPYTLGYASLQQLMHPVGFFLSGGQSFGIYS
jgi:hypothetical protein